MLREKPHKSTSVGIERLDSDLAYIAYRFKRKLAGIRSE